VIVLPLVLHEVGPRDGLQMEKQVVPTEVKLRWTERLIDAGLDVVQVGSFVNPARVPQMADTDVLLRRLREARPTSRTLLSALVLNQKGLDRALAAGVDLVCMGVSASETHSRHNTGRGVDENLRETTAMAARATDSGFAVQVSVQSAFGCGYEGVVPPDRVLGLARSLIDAGVPRLSLADTAGHATPETVHELFTRLAAAGAREMACHFHDTYGLALANCCAAIQAGVTWFETSVAGLGGCPFTAVAGGNTCTEDFVHYLQRRGLRKDVRLDPLLTLARDVASWFGREMPGSVYKAGRIPEPVQRP
jgi:hydroxymethylglutaryl-CoA lyase